MTTWCGCNAYNPDNLDIDGVRCTFTMPATPPVGAWWISCYSKAIIWAQVGIEYDGNLFYAVFNHGQMIDRSKPGGRQRLNPGDHVFEISVQAKNRWHYLIDNKAIGAYGMGAPTGYPGLIECLNEDGDGSTATFSNISMRRNGVWSPLPASTSVVADDGSGGGAITGVFGHLQDASLPAASVRIGGPANIGNATPLW